MKRFAIGTAGVALSLAAYAPNPVRAHDYAVGPLKIGHPWARASPPSAKVGGGYLAIENTGPEPDRLVGGSTEGAARVEIHESSLADGIMRMRERTDGVAVPPGQTLEFKPGGLHLMLVDLKAPLKQGDKVKATLVFERAGTVAIELQVQGVGAPQPAATGHTRH
ncbi:MAG: copper chaperone PCu(A)C [Beijerinckiaceae bacterium]|jgi:copper(I)-binding protein|uniref:copper chaperone PCu(A)C n=1 Tax=Bosea sp. (in: a-proteobacteria) TaxID=1871050 RepID=UPI00082CAE97|nr:copper chaperone PCu(A)C [Bosea sp. (in: a-proteobacteria)]MBX9907875.1 copper chaperone PCu(A)C [Beijerinckiaceae bacterium]